MFDIEHRKGDRPVGRQIIYSNFLIEALASAKRVATRLGADHMTVSDDHGELLGVFQASYRVH